MQDLNKIWTSCVDTLEKQNIVEDKIMLDSLFRPATLEAIEDNKVTITTDLQWNIDPILEKQSEIESILSNSFSKPITINVLSKEEYNKKKLKQKKVPKIDSHLHPDMTFSNFIVGNSNRMAQNAALLVSTNPGKNFNPLFLYSHPGLGKTHLLNAIGNRAKETNPDLVVRYITSKDFVDEIINSIKTNTTDDIYSYYRNIDILLIDDIQFLSKKEQTQTEFFNTFNELYNNNKQIVITSDRPASDLKDIMDRLTSRFEWGLQADIQIPDTQTRIEIMKKKLAGENINLEEFPEEVLEFIASKFNSNVRTLEGALKRLIFYATINNSDFTIELANEALRDLFKAEQKNSKVDVNNIIKEVGAYYDVSVADILSKKRKKNIAYARQVAMFLTRELTGSSFPKIGEAFSGRDHTTIMHGCEKIEKELKESDELKKAISDLKQVLS